MTQLLALGAILLLAFIIWLLVSVTDRFTRITRAARGKNVPSGEEVKARLDAIVQKLVSFQSKRADTIGEQTIGFLRTVLPEINPFRPNESETLSMWDARKDVPLPIIEIRNLAYSSIAQKLNELMRHEERQANARSAAKSRTEEKQKRDLAGELLARNEAKVQKFLEVAYRKVATPDEYGDENPKALDAEIRRFISKLGDTEQKLAKAAKMLSDKRSETFALRFDPLVSAIAANLRGRFKAYYRRRKASPADVSLDSMSGLDFELYLAGLLNSVGIVDVSTTPKTGDQGADLLFSKEGKKYVVQAKRYSSSVGNKAVQEAHAAKGYYGCDTALVITNSKFTTSARALAKELGVLLVEGDQLEQLPSLIDGGLVR